MRKATNDLLPASDLVSDYLADTRSVLTGLPVDQIKAVILELERAYNEGRQVLIIGNGGSASSASHLACDLAKTVLGRPVNRSAKRFRALALTDLPAITAWANDFTFDAIFSEQIETLGQPGDLLVAITGSGNSPNIVAGVEMAKRLGMRSVGLLGFDGGRVKGLVDAHVIVPSDDYGHIEDMHLVLAHLVTAYFSQVAQTQH